jgi:PTS system cellobiose-specific IIB component
MKKILLVCAGGFSTSMLMQKMKESALQENLDVEIEAIGEASLEDHNDCDIVLLGPQIAYREKDLSQELNIPVKVLSAIDYGMMNGQNVLKFALDSIKESEEHK